MPVPRPLHRILSTKLTRFLLIPSIVFVVFIGGFFSYRQYANLKQQDKLLADSLARYAEAYVEDALYALKHLAYRANQSEEQSLTLDLRQMHTTFPHFERLLWVNAENIVLAAYPTGLKGVDFPLLFPQAQTHPELLLSRPIYSPEANKLTIYVGHVAPGGGRAIAELDLSALQDHLKLFSPAGGERNIVITDAYGNVIVHPDQRLVRQQVNIGGEELLQSLGKDSHGYSLHKDGDLYFFSSLVRMESLRWVLALSTSANAVFFPIAQTVIALVVFLVAFFLMMTALFRAELNKDIVTPLSSFAALIKHTARDRSIPPASAPDQTFAELAAIEDEFALMYREIAHREHLLRQGRKYIRSVIDSLPSVFAALDADGIVTQWSSGAHDLAGIPAGDAIGRPILELLPQLEPVTKMISQVLQEQRPASLDRLNWNTESGTAIYHLEVYPLQDAPERGAVLRMDNVTTRMRLEEIMIQTEKMMSVGGLAAGMAHEINNPLGGILQGAQNILRRFDPELPANIKAAQETNLELSTMQAYLDARRIPKMLEGIITSGKRAADIVSNMLNFSRNSAPCHTHCELHQLIDTVIGLASSDYDLKKRYDFRNIKIIRNFDSDLPLLPCTTTEIEQVIFNLLKNAAHAIDSMPEPPSEPTITISTRVRPPYVQVSITDNGPGIPENIRSRIFEPFFTTKEVGKGTGLGLSVSYFIITNNHSGTFAVDSTPGQGTTFTISLPLNASPEHTVPPCAQS
ncbi:PAS domain-containing sensor histidine kinase [Desulfovibrio ferrophilus]|uniref:histidine kinase n=1 Tax=Desulfovibrio ferrophilus TaxID=241368 RepID=A0A2Z6B153_9BACT|nr:PAS domain-containing sensor histidine kinase [Desulfovibrio ferrophilus]BBD09178.1 PAS/PAC sensor signal transduction histidine kinase [Desulfovibrio ferrophilus]